MGGVRSERQSDVQKRPASVCSIFAVAIELERAFDRLVCFRTIAVKKCIGDRVPGIVAWNLFDSDAKFGNVHTVDEWVNSLARPGDVRA